MPNRYLKFGIFILQMAIQKLHSLLLDQVTTSQEVSDSVNIKPMQRTGISIKQGPAEISPDF